MKSRYVLRGVLLSALVVCASAARAETKVTVSDTHLCCKACVNGVNDAVAGLEGVSVQCDQKAKTVAITAKDTAAAQKAVDALAEAGFYGQLDNKDVKYKPVAAPSGKVARLEVSGVHNCCGACTKAIKAAVNSVSGVKADTATPKVESFVVEGDFSAQAVVDALLKAGFHAAVK